jgi:O-antigen/teichoic acid export membrane protein
VISTLVLVRLLLPADFGLVALSTSFAQATEGLSELGVEEAVIRHRDPARAIFDTGFTMNAIRGLATALLILLLARPAGHFFADPRLTNVVAALTLATLLDGVANIGTTQFRRDLAFSKEFQLWILPRIIAATLTIATAAIFRSYWALVVGILAQCILRVAFSYRMHKFRPRFAIGAWRSLIIYSAWTWVLSLVMLVRDRSDSILIGRMLNPAAVGIYALGRELGALPATELIEPLNRAAFSGFAAGRNAELPAGRSYLRIVGAMATLTLPAGMGISLVAAPLIRLTFGPAWVATVPLVEVIGLAARSAPRC